MKQSLQIDLLPELLIKHLNNFTAPGSYDVEKSEKKVLHSSSAYSFGTKYKEQKIDDIPGMNFTIKIILFFKTDRSLLTHFFKRNFNFCVKWYYLCTADVFYLHYYYFRYYYFR